MDPLRSAASDNKSGVQPAGNGSVGAHGEAASAGHSAQAAASDTDATENDYSALFNCVSRLYQDKTTSGVIRELIDSSGAPDNKPPGWPALDVGLINSNQPGHFNYSISPQETTESSTSFSPADGSNLTLEVDWASLSKKLPAWESPYQLEALNESWQLYLTIIYTLTAVTSFILNAITVIALTRSRRSELRKYLINLSLSDLLMSLFSIPFTYTEYMLGRWIFAAFLCPLVRFVGEFRLALSSPAIKVKPLTRTPPSKVTLSVFVSVATMTVIGINRHLAIMYPLKRKKYSKGWTLRKTQVILLIWLLGIGISTPEYLMFSAEPFCYNGQLVYDCRHSYGDSISDSYTVFIYLSTFVVPLMLLSYLYTSIGVKLWRRQMPGNVDVNRDLTMQCKRVKVVKMLLVVVVLFAVFWLPLQTFSMIMFLYPDIRKGFEYQSVQYNIFIATYFTCHWLSMAHSCLNPLIYCFMNDKFRSELRALVCRGRRKRQHQLMDTYSTTIRNCHSVQSQSFRSRPQLQQQPQLHATLTCTSSCSTNNNNNNRLEPTSRVDLLVVRPADGQHDDEEVSLASQSISCDTFDHDQDTDEVRPKSPEKMLKLVNKLAMDNQNHNHNHSHHQHQQVFVQVAHQQQASANNNQSPHKGNGQLLVGKVTETLTEVDEDEAEEERQNPARSVDLMVVVVGPSQQAEQKNSSAANV